jgi:hypothetical protein
VRPITLVHATRMRRATRLSVLFMLLCLLPECVDLSVTMLDGVEFRSSPVAGQPKIGTTFYRSFVMFGRTIPLPDGAWTVLAAQSRRDPATGRWSGGIALVQRNGPSLLGLVQAVAADRKMLAPEQVPAICTSSDVLWNDIRQAVPFGSQDCSSIYFERPDLWWISAFTLPEQVLGSLRDADITPPHVVVALHLYEAGTGLVLTESVALNPESRGIAPDAYMFRGQSSWTAVGLAHDPAKLKLLDDLKNLAVPLRATLRTQADSTARFGPPRS